MGNNKFKIEDVYSGVGNSIVVTKELGEEVEVMVLSNNPHTKILHKKYLGEYKKGSLLAISKLLDKYSKDFPNLYTDISGNIFLTNVDYEKIKKLDEKANKLKNSERRMERLREIRRKHVRVILCTPKSEGELDIIENCRIEGNEDIDDLISSLGLCFNNGEISSNFLSGIFSQAEFIYKSLNKILK